IVVTLGNPYAIARDGQVSAGWGIVANLSRKAPPTPDGTDSTGKQTLHHFGTLIQTDAKLNLGTSGGPLLNLKGEMVGLTVALAATTGYETSAGYAIPIDATFRRVIDTLRDGREVEYGLLGIQPANLTARELLAGLHGIRVDRVVPGTPAERYDLRPDDIVTAVDGTPIHEADALVLQVGKLPVEAVARLSVIRDGRSRPISVTLAKYPVRGKKIVTNRPQPWRGVQVDYATALVNVQPQQQSMPAAFDEGVAVIDVVEGSAAWDSGLRRGMLISHVNRTSVRTPSQFRDAVAGRFGPVELRTVSDEGNATLTVAAGL
ncbi:MAG TPA: PDZ domain-containing protein, partial [Thermoguttaceae bacterium]|nr:PDZ domain-containing protein [Thermoguttaceae bacterium]